MANWIRSNYNSDPTIAKIEELLDEMQFKLDEKIYGKGFDEADDLLNLLIEKLPILLNYLNNLIPFVRAKQITFRKEICVLLECNFELLSDISTYLCYQNCLLAIFHNDIIPFCIKFIDFEPKKFDNIKDSLWWQCKLRSVEIPVQLLGPYRSLGSRTRTIELGFSLTRSIVRLVVYCNKERRKSSRINRIFGHLINAKKGKHHLPPKFEELIRRFILCIVNKIKFAGREVKIMALEEIVLPLLTEFEMIDLYLASRIAEMDSKWYDELVRHLDEPQRKRLGHFQSLKKPQNRFPATECSLFDDIMEMSFCLYVE